jgi:hypothetical protein
LLSLHASNNPGITEDLKDYVWRRIRAKNPVVQYHHIEMEADKEEKSWTRTMKSHRCDKLLKESLEVREMGKKALDNGGLTEIAATHSATNLIFNRYLGHQKDIPGSA